MSQNYLKNPGRLQEVLQLIQITGLRENYQSEAQTMDKDFGPRTGKDSWAIVAGEHPEFFRTEGASISLLARHYLKDNKTRPPLLFEDIKKLLDIAILLHERQVRAQERESAKNELRAKYWGLIGTIIGVIATGLFGIIANLLKH